MSDQTYINKTKMKDVRRFGIIAFLFFGALCALGLWRHKPVPIYLFGALSVLGIGFVLFPSKLTPVYTIWLKVAHFIGKIITSPGPQFIKTLTHSV